MIPSDMNDDGFNDLVVTVNKNDAKEIRIFLFDNGQFSSSSRSLSEPESHQRVVAWTTYRLPNVQRCEVDGSHLSAD